MSSVEADSEWPIANYMKTLAWEEIKSPVRAVSKNSSAAVAYVANYAMRGQDAAADAVAWACSYGRMVVVGNEEMGPDGSAEGLYARLWVVFELLCANLMLIPVDFVEGRKSWQYLFGDMNKSCKLASCGNSADEERIRECIEKMPIAIIMRAHLGSTVKVEDHYSALDTQIHIVSKIDADPMSLSEALARKRAEAVRKVEEAAARKAAKLKKEAADFTESCNVGVSSATGRQSWTRSPTVKRESTDSQAKRGSGKAFV